MASARPGMALGPIQRLFDEGTLTGLTDSQLLNRFLAQQDEAAFAALVGRHGPMVLAVCRGALKNTGDAEDAFQATFLVLFRKARGLRSAGSLGSWLHRVAYRIALRANAGAARRRERTGEEVVMAAEAAPADGGPGDREILPIVHAEIDRLPDKYRAPIALCFLEGLSYEQAAHQLGWPIGTVGSRINRARELLRSRLARRGVTATVAGLSALMAREASAAPVSAPWFEAAARTVITLGVSPAGAKAAGAVPAAVILSDQILGRMAMIRLIQLTSVLTVAVVATTGLLAWNSFGLDGDAKPVGIPAAKSRRAADPGPATPETGPIRGRVVAPDGRPVRDAAVYIGRWETGWAIEPVARTDSDGRFRIVPQEIAREHPDAVRTLDWKRAELTASAPGYGAIGFKVADAGGGEVELRLVVDDVPLRGRILDMQGRPLAGVTVQVAGINDPPAGDLDAMLASGSIEPGRASRGFYDAAWWTKQGSEWTRRTLRSGDDGRIRIEGAGRDRLVLLEFRAPGIGAGRLWAMTRPAPPSARPRPVTQNPASSPGYEALHGADFTLVASPSKPIEGVVRSKETGRPLGGIQVMALLKDQPGASVSADTDAQGRFRIDGLAKMPSYQVYVHPGPGQPYLPTSMDLTDTDGLKPIPVALELLRGVLIRGRLVDRATGKSVAGRAVYHAKMPSNPNPGQAAFDVAPFGPEGFRMTVPPGPGFFYAEAAGEGLPYVRARLAPADRGKGIGGETDGEAIAVILSPCHTYRIVDVPAGAESFSLDLELTRGASRRGRLIDPAGKPVVGAMAYGLSSNWEVKTLGDAGFEVVGLEPDKPRLLAFAHPKLRLGGATVVEPGGGPVEVRMDPCGAAVGRLVDTDGLPIADALVTLSPQEPGGQAIPGGIGLWPQGEVFIADKDGRFRVEGVNPGLSFRLLIRPRSRPDRFLVPEKSKEAVLNQLRSSPGEVVDLGEIVVTRQPNG